MSRTRFLSLTALLLLPMPLLAAVAPLYINTSVLTEVPQIDAQEFINEGSFTVASALAYETQNTLKYSNLGLMSGSPGFRFETVSATSGRLPAQVFYNDFDAMIEATAIPSLPFPIFPDDPSDPNAVANITRNLLFTAEKPQIIINATEVVNRGHLRAESGGLIRVTGGKIDLVRSDLGVEPILGGSGFTTPTNFFPESGIIDSYWGLNDASSTDANVGIPILSPGTIAAPAGQVFRATSPLHRVTNLARVFGFNTSLRLTNALAWVRTNAVTPTNWLVQVVLVQSKDTNIAVDVKFLPSTIPTNLYRTAVVKLSTPETNVLDAATFLREVYLTDTIASETNFVLLTNLLTLTTYRPGTFDVTRTPPLGFTTGQGTNAPLSRNLLAHPGYSNNIVANIYSGYSFIVTNILQPVPNVPGVSTTNLESRVELIANTLNLNRTRLRSDGAVVIQSTDFLGSTNAAIDSPNMVLNIASPTPSLKIENLVEEFVQRTAGPCFAWSGMWTNQFGIDLPPSPDPAAPTNAVVDIGFHVLILDSQIVRDVPVFVKDFKVTSESILLNDVVRATDTFLVDATHWTIGSSSRVILGSSIQNLNASNLPRLTTFENHGALTLPGQEILGADRSAPYESIINRGTNIAFNFSISSKYFENTSRIFTDVGSAPPRAGTFVLTAETAKIDGGSVATGGEVTLNVDHLKLRNASISSLEAIRLTIDGSMADAAEEATNFISGEGIHLLTKPPTGDFLGTIITSKLPKFLAIPHTWAGEDRGASVAGYANNAAVGRLVLEGAQDSLFVFSGASQGNGLYVDFLELKGSAQTDIASALQIDSNLIIYFADSNVPAESLDGLFADAGAPQGRLRWVRDFVGLQSSVDVASRSLQSTVRMNRSVRESLTLDSDSDGVVNGHDDHPLDVDSFGLSVQGFVATGASRTLNLTWQAIPGATYVVEYATDLSTQQWFALGTQKNETKTAQPAAMEARVSLLEPQRYYRVRIIAQP